MNLLKTSFLSAIETGIKLASGFLVLKYLSLRTGPEGIATFGQFQNFVAAATAMCTGAFVTGLVRYVSESYDRGDSRPHVEHAVGFACLLMVILAIPLLSAPGFISEMIFGTDDYAWAFTCLALALPFSALFQIMLALLNGSGHVRELIISKSASSLLLLVLSFVLVTTFGLVGGLASLVLAPASAIIVALALVARTPQIDWTWFRPRLDRNAINRFLPYWVMSMTTVISTPIVLMLVRTSIGNQLGWASAGYWEASWRIAELYLLVITTALSVYYVPQLSKTAAGPAERDLILKTITFAVGSSGILALTIYLLREFVVLLMFSRDFMPVTDILAPQLLGSVVRIGCWVIAYHMIVRGKVLTMVCSEMFFGFTLYVGSIYMTHQFGLIGASYAFLANSIAYVFFAAAYYRYAIGRTEEIVK